MGSVRSGDHDGSSDPGGDEGEHRSQITPEDARDSAHGRSGEAGTEDESPEVGGLDAANRTESGVENDSARRTKGSDAGTKDRMRSRSCEFERRISFG